jgi:WD40 repeat protein/Cdc6-like AAA superfamily ATPase
MTRKIEFDEVKKAVDQLLTQQRSKALTPTESAAIEGIWDGQQYKHMEKRFNRTPKALKQAAYQLWKPLSEALDKKVSKSNFRNVMESHLINSAPESSLVRENNELDGLDCNFPKFVGRGEELNELTQQIQAGCRLIVVTGTSGIGKTCLIGKLVGRLRKHFKHSYYTRAEDVRSFSDLYAEFARRVNSSVLDNTSQSPDSTEMVRVIMQLFRQHRCLLVVDQTELFYQTNELGVFFSDANTVYKQLLARVIEDGHRSCLVWIGREHLSHLSDFPGRVFLCHLNGLSPADAQKLLQSQSRLNGTEEDRQQLTEFCGGHPKLLLEVAGYINHVHNGTMSAFLRTSLPFPKQLRVILGEMLERLAEPEKALLYWLVLQPLTNQELRNQITPTWPHLDDIEDSLIRRRILEREPIHNSFWVLHPPILAMYAARQLVDVLVQELLDGKPVLLHRYPVLMSTVPAYRQAQQRNYVLEPLAASLKLACHNDEATLYTKLANTLKQVKETTGSVPSYAASNLLTIAGHLGVSLAGCAFSGLEIRQADLRYVNLRDVSCIDCSFSDPVFTTGLSKRLVTALHPNGVSLAIGDATGRLVLWDRIDDDERLRFVGYCRLKYAVKFIAFGTDGLLVVATAENAIHLWWNRQIETIADETLSTPTTIRSLCLSPSSKYLAAGLDDGQIILWNLRSATLLPMLRQAHTGVVLQLTFSHDNQQFASFGDDNRVLLWNVATQTCLKEIPSDRYYTLLTIGWASSHLQIGEVLQGEGSQNNIYLLSTDRTLQTWLDHTGIVLSLAFSPDARYLVSSHSDHTVRIWNSETDTTSILTGFTEPPIALTLSSDGRALLASTGERVQLRDIVNQRCLWEIKATPGEQLYERLNLRGAIGIPSAARDMLTDLGAIYRDTSTSEMQ